MKVSIDVPVRKSLTPNETKVYKLLCEGLEPTEIAQEIHMPLTASPFANFHDVPPDTVRGLIASIRGKGWDVPEIKSKEPEPAATDTSSRGKKN